MVLALLAFAVAIYWLTGSLWTTAIQTIICAVIIQLGYVLGVLFMVWRAGNPVQELRADDKRVDATKVGSDVFHNHF